MTKPTYLRVGAGPIVFVLAVIMGCGVRDDAPHDGVEPAKISALSDAQVAAAKQVGLIPSGYLPLTIYDPVSDPGILNLNDSALSTSGMAINNSSLAVGYTGYNPYPLQASSLGEPFFADAGGAHPLPIPWSGGMAYATGVNDLGDILAYGYDGPLANGGNLHGIIYHTDRSYQILSLPIPPYYGYAPAPRMFRVGNVRGSDGIPMLLGGGYIRAGTLGVWHLDGDAQDSVGSTSFTPPNGEQWVSGGHTGEQGDQALHLDGSACPSSATGTDTWVEFADDNASSAGLTMMAWVRPDPSMCPGGPRVVLARGGSYELALACNPDGSAGVASATSSGGALNLSAPAGVVPFAPSWSHIAVSWDFHRLRTYVNGVKVADTPTNGVAVYYPPATSTFSLGCQSNVPSTSFIGDIDEVSAFRNGMGADQIFQFAGNHTNYPPQTVNGGVNRYSDSFYDIVLQPTGGAYSNTVGGGDLGSVNDAGMFVGAAGLAAGGMTAVMYDPAMGWTNLNDLVPPDSDWNLQNARGISNSNLVVGWGTHNGRHSAFRLDVTTGDVVDIGHKPEPPFDDPSLYIYAEAVNTQGHAVGAVYDQYPAWPQRAIVYTDELGLTDLNALIDPSNGWTLLEARAINDRDEVVGIAKNGAGAVRAFKLGLTVPTQANVQVEPVIDCLAPIATGKWRALFGYINSGSQNVQLEQGSANLLVPNNVPVLQTSPATLTWFAPGSHRGTFLVDFTGAGTVTWQLGSGQVSTTGAPVCNVTQSAAGAVVELSTPQGPQVVVIDPDPAAVFQGGVVDTETFYSLADQVEDQALQATGDDPLGPRAAGTLNGSFRVTNDGQARYEIPIEVPPARGGVTPRLSFAYESQRQDGLLGPGWSLQGLSRIDRCTQIPAVALQIGQSPHPIQFDDGDQFCLDGDRLIKVGGSNGSVEYRTEREALSRILATSFDSLGPTQFLVYRPDGLIETYGGSGTSALHDASRDTYNVAADGTITTGTARVRLSWLISRVADRFGNVMTVSYLYEAASVLGIPNAIASDPLPQEIRYASNDNTGALGTKSVQFFYSNRVWPTRLIYVAGVLQSRPVLLDHVDVTGPSPVSEGLVRQYRLTYHSYTMTPSADVATTGRPLLKRIQKCDGAGKCQTPTRFGWETPRLTFTRSHTNIADASNIGFNYAAAQNYENVSRVIQAQDINGDGEDDILYREPIPNVTIFHPDDPSLDPAYLFRLSNGDGTFSASAPTGFEKVTPGAWAGLSPPMFVPMDIDLDGRIDGAILKYGGIAYGMDPANSFWDIYQATGTGLARLPLGVVVPSFFDGSVNPEYRAATSWGVTLVSADLDGDGYPEVFRPLNDDAEEMDTSLRVQWIGMRHNDQGVLGAYQQLFVHNDPSIENPLFWQTDVIPVDIDNDGRQELVFRDLSNPDAGDIYTQAPTLSAVHLDGTVAHSWRTALPKGFLYVFADLNGDGLKDAIHATSISGDAAEIWANTGTGFVRVQTISDPNLAFRLTHSRAIDLDQDGREDLVYLSCARPGGLTFPFPYAQPTAYLSRGDGTFDAIDLTDVSAGATGALVTAAPDATVPFKCLSTLGDFNGDGQMDVLQAEPGTDTLDLYTASGTVGNRLVSIEDGNGRTITVTYGPSGAAADTCSYPMSCKSPNSRVVRSYQLEMGGPQGTGQFFSVGYEHPVTDLLGRGWQGFGQLTIRNETTGVTRTTVYSNNVRSGSTYPLAGLVKQETVTTPLPAAGMIRGRTRTIEQFQFITGDPGQGTPYAVRPAVIDDVEIDSPANGEPTSFPVQHTVTTLQYDAFGNTLSKLVEWPNLGTSEKMTAVYDAPDTDSWLVSLLDSITLHSRGQNGEESDRVTNCLTSTITGAIDRLVTEPNGSADEKLTVDFTRDPLDGVITAVTTMDRAGARRMQTFTYDSDRTFPRTTSNPVGQTTTTVYHPGLGVLINRTDANGVGTRWTYDGLGRLRGQLADDGSGISLSYQRPYVDNGYQVPWQRNGGGSGTTIYDKLGRVIRTMTATFDGNQRFVDTTYDDTGTGKIKSVTRPYVSGGDIFLTTFNYDLLGRPLSVAPSGSDAITSDYSTVGGLITTVRRGGLVNQIRFEDEMGHVTTTQSFADATRTDVAIASSYEYGAFDQLRRVRNYGDGQMNVTELSYDSRGRQTDLIDPDIGHTITRYNSFGDVRESVAGDGVATFYTVDALGRVVSATRSGETDLFAWDVAEHGIGVPAFSISKTAVVDAYAYDALGRLNRHDVTVDGGRPFVFQYGYDGFGRLNARTYPSVSAGPAFTVGTTFSSVDGAAVEVTGGTFVGSIWRKVAESEAGEIAQEAFGDALQTARHYDPNTGWLRHIVTGSGTLAPGSSAFPDFASSVQNLTYAYFSNGNLRERGDLVLGTDETFAFDNADRLITWTPDPATTVAYEYSDVGNLKARRVRGTTGNVDEVFGYGENGAGPHAVTSAPWGAFAYDHAGRQTSRPSQPSLSYNRFDLPDVIQQTGSAAVSFEYDASGARVEKRTPASTTIYVAGLYERRSDSIGISHVLYIPAAGRIVGQIVCHGPAGQASCDLPIFLHEDQVGSIDTIVDGSGSSSHVKHDPFGRLTSNGGGSSTGSVTLGFTGEAEDPDLGLVNLNHRLYDPRLARFTTPDPLVGYPYWGQAYNRYSYAYNNPVALVDRTGLQALPADSFPPPMDAPPPVPVIKPGNPGFFDEVEWKRRGAERHRDDFSRIPPPDAHLQARPVVGWLGFSPYEAPGLFSPAYMSPEDQRNYDDMQARAAADALLALPNAVMNIITLGGWKNKAWAPEPNTVTSPEPSAVEEVLDVLAVAGPSLFRIAARDILLARVAAAGAEELDAAADAAAGAGRNAGTRLPEAAAKAMCFPAGTEVQTPDGARKIDDVGVGAEVYVFDESAQRVAIEKVTDTSRSWATALVEVVVGPDRILSTKSHRYWVPSERRWVAAGELARGMDVLLLDGERRRIEDVRVREAPSIVPVFNLAIGGTIITSSVRRVYWCITAALEVLTTTIRRATPLLNGCKSEVSNRKSRFWPNSAASVSRSEWPPLTARSGFV
jgi:RHS repeat-associated protein